MLPCAFWYLIFERANAPFVAMPFVPSSFLLLEVVHIVHMLLVGMHLLHLVTSSLGEPSVNCDKI